MSFNKNYVEIRSEVIRKELEISGIQDVRLKYKQNWINHLERMENTRLAKNTPSATNLEEEETVDAQGNDGNASMPEQVKRLNPWRKMVMMITPAFSGGYWLKFVSLPLISDRL